MTLALVNRCEENEVLKTSYLWLPLRLLFKGLLAVFVYSIVCVSVCVLVNLSQMRGLRIYNEKLVVAVNALSLSAAQLVQSEATKFITDASDKRTLEITKSLTDEQVINQSVNQSIGQHHRPAVDRISTY